MSKELTRREFLQSSASAALKILFRPPTNLLNEIEASFLPKKRGESREDGELTRVSTQPNLLNGIEASFPPKFPPKKRGEPRKGEELTRVSTQLFGGRYLVEPGDNLDKIAARHGLRVESIVEANRMENPSLIFPDQELVLPADPQMMPTALQVGDFLFSQIQTLGWLKEEGKWEEENPWIDWFWQHSRDPRVLWAHRNSLLGQELVKKTKRGTKIEIFANWEHQAPALGGEIREITFLPREQLDDENDWQMRRFAFKPDRLGIGTCHPNVPDAPERLLYSAILERKDREF